MASRIYSPIEAAGPERGRINPTLIVFGFWEKAGVTPKEIITRMIPVMDTDQIKNLDSFFIPSSLYFIHGQTRIKQKGKNTVGLIGLIRKYDLSIRKFGK
jgi:hypothetical protein